MGWRIAFAEALTSAKGLGHGGAGLNARRRRPGIAGPSDMGSEKGMPELADIGARSGQQALQQREGRCRDRESPALMTAPNEGRAASDLSAAKRRSTIRVVNNALRASPRTKRCSLSRFFLGRREDAEE